MYPIDEAYSMAAHMEWRRQEALGISDELTEFKQSWKKVRDGQPWDVSSWDELREAIAFLTLMNKRIVLYFRGQGKDTTRCSPVLFRDSWCLKGKEYRLTTQNRPEYYAAIRSLQPHVLRIASAVGTPRRYILEHVPAATAAILQHYELWPTHFVDVTRSLPTAISFGEADGKRSEAFLYVFGLPDLHGSITFDIDQQLALARLEAVCPPSAKRPHHQDAYLVSRFPEPTDLGGWSDWERKSDLMRRLVCKFRLRLSDGRLPGTPRMEQAFLIPLLSNDLFGKSLNEELEPIIESQMSRFAG
jgi:hypothetical protein